MKNNDKKVFIGSVELSSNLILAPMAGFTDLAFRELCTKYGAGLTVTEMVSAKALLYKNKKTEDILYALSSTHPVAVQIFGHEPEVMAKAVKNPLLDNFDIIDINMGCPAPKIFKNGDGSALLNNMDLAQKIIEACVNATDKPITVKFRLGYDENNIIATKFAQMCERAGASAITIHGRTVKQGYSGNADYNQIALVKKSVKIPVFANGDCKTYDDYKNILNLTGADGVMIGRAALGKPEIFSEILGQKNLNEDKLNQIIYHYETLLKFYPERFVVLNMRSHLPHYLKGKNKNSEVITKLIKSVSFAEIKQILTHFYR